MGNVQMALKNSYCYEVANLDPFIVIIKTIRKSLILIITDYMHHEIIMHEMCLLIER